MTDCCRSHAAGGAAACMMMIAGPVALLVSNPSGATHSDHATPGPSAITNAKDMQFAQGMPPARWQQPNSNAPTVPARMALPDRTGSGNAPDTNGSGCMESEIGCAVQAR